MVRTMEFLKTRSTGIAYQSRLSAYCTNAIWGESIVGTFAVKAVAYDFVRCFHWLYS